MSTDDLKALLGDSANEFQRKFGGEAIYFPTGEVTESGARVLSHSAEVYRVLNQHFAGRRVYIPKIAAAVISPRELLAREPDAPVWRVMSACNVSRVTYFRAKKEMRNE